MRPESLHWNIVRELRPVANVLLFWIIVGLFWGHANVDFYWLSRASSVMAHSGPQLSLITFMMSVLTPHWETQCEQWSITFAITNDNVITITNSRILGADTHSRSAFEYEPIHQILCSCNVVMFIVNHLECCIGHHHLLADSGPHWQ